MIKFKTRKLQKGFTLLEVLVAISIFTVSTLALLSVLSQGISSTTYAKRKIVASYLAQEGIEYVRNLRDTLVLSGVDSQTGWNTFKTDNISTKCVSGCYWDDDLSDHLVPCSSPALCPNMTYDEAVGIYGYNLSWADSGYNRVITFEILVSSPDEVKIYSTVEWNQGSGSQSITFSDILFNWIE